ncbi:MAG: hypothetical protein ACYC63_01180 [Armatimonadota bacterium]
MRRMMWALMLVVAVGAMAQDSWEERRDKLGSREEPYRILVDKVLSLSNQWVMTPEHVAEIKAAGFNVVVPRIGADDNVRVERVARMAQAQNMFYMPWIRGTIIEKGDPKLRFTDARGRHGELGSPNADALWDYWRDRILFYARLSREVPSVMGVFLDFENYDPGSIGGGMCYTLSYDEPVLQRFAAAQGIALPDPLPTDRAAWLGEQKLTELFRDYQVTQWRTRARELREAVDALNPRFQFVVYPASHSLFIQEAVWREWHTRQAPLIMAEVDTYWRREFELGAALENVRKIVVNRRAELDKVDPTIRYMAGLDPVVEGANPEFEGKSAVLGAEFTHGYWVFYEGPEYATTHKDYFAWFRRANDLIARQDYALWRQPAETPNPMADQISKDARRVAGAKLVPLSTEEVPEAALKQVFTHRPGATYQVLLEKGERLQGELIALRHAHHATSNVAVIVSPAGKTLAIVQAAAGQTAPLDLVAPEEGVYGISVTCSGAKGQLRVTNRYFCLAGPRLTLAEKQPLAYLAPRAGAAEIAFKVAGQGQGEHLDVTLKAPDGTVAFTGNTRDGWVGMTLDLRAATGGQRAAWSLELANVVEDISLDLHGCEPRMATHPGRLLVSAD